MSQEYIKTEIDKVFKEYEKNDRSLAFAMATAWIMGHFKGFNLKVLKLPKENPLADYFVICSTTNTMQSNAIADEVGDHLNRLGITHSGKEGKHQADWILLDFKEIIVHVFLDHARDAYSLEERWSKGDIVKIPDHFYHELPQEKGEVSQSDDKKKGSNDDDKTFF